MNILILICSILLSLVPAARLYDRAPNNWQWDLNNVHIQKVENDPIQTSGQIIFAAEHANERTWNSNTFINRNGSMTTVISGGWVNYLGEDNTWTPIDLVLRDQVAYWDIAGAPFKVQIPKYSGGQAIFISDNKWDIFNQTAIRDNPFSYIMVAEDVANVPGEIEQGDVGFGLSSYVVYKNAYPAVKADLIYYLHQGRAPCLMKLIRFNQNPGDAGFSFIFEFSSEPDVWNEKQNLSQIDKKAIESILMNARKLEKDKLSPISVNLEELRANKLRKEKMLNTKITVQGGIANYTSEQRGIGFKSFQIWDSGVGDQRKKELIKIDYEKLSATSYRLTKKIKTKFFDNVIYPVYTDTSSTFNPNPSVETTSVDGWVRRSGVNESWATIRAGAGVSALDDGASNAQGGGSISATATANQWNDLRRGYFLFDTSAIPDGDPINSAVFSLKIFGHVDNYSQNLSMTDVYPTSNTALAAADFDLGTAAGTHGTTLQCDTDVDIGAMSDGVYSNWTLNDAGLGNINKTGISKFGTMLSGDQTNTEPSPWSSGASALAGPYFAETDLTTSDPKLVVDHGSSAVYQSGLKVIHIE